MKTTLAILLCCLSCSALPLREALSQIESNNDDHAKGRAGEISRYQILPSVWREHTSSRNYHNGSVAWTVAQRIIKPRQEAFSRATGRQPDAREVYCLYNAPGAFERAGWKVSGVGRRVRERAKRFENLINEK